MPAIEPISFRTSADALAKGILAAIEQGRMPDAGRLGVFFAALHGHRLAEAYALSATAFAKSGNVPAALRYWDKCISNYPQKLIYLAHGLRYAWSLAKTTEASVYADKWLAMLEGIFITVPDFALLRELEQKGHNLAGSCGIHLGSVHAWLWLRHGERPVIRTDLPAEMLNVSLRPVASDGKHVLHILSLPLPPWQKPYNIAITDSYGRHLRGSPMLCSGSHLTSQAAQIFKNAQLTVIIPVYDDRRATLATLASVFASRKYNKIPFQILAVWDHGPDESLNADLRRLVGQNKIALLETPGNYGFLGAVNHALRSVPSGDVILLNADTLVHGNWVDRLAEAARMPDAATVTAMGSQAEHMSFPSWHNRCEVTDLRTAALIDNACAKIPANEALFRIPVGVGFCMLITRRALNAIGGLDGHAVCRGYGEESDFCLRADKADLVNYGACNIFVAHLQGRSFGATKQCLVAQNNVGVKKRFPHYEKFFDDFIMADDSRRVREKISVELCGQLQLDTLHIYPWSMAATPIWDNVKPADVDQGMAALFVLPYSAKSGQAVLRIRGSSLPLCDMNFNLPRDNEILRRLGNVFQRVEGHNLSGSAVVLVRLCFPDMTCPRDPHTETCRVINVDTMLLGRNFIAAAPHNMKQAVALRKLAANNPYSAILVYKLKKYLRNMPMPRNIMELPITEDCHDLYPTALIVHPQTDIAAWKLWRQKDGLEDMPIFCLEDK